MVVNHQGKSSHENYELLKSKVEEQIPVYQQEINKPDVWKLLQGNKDDFLVYDRCGKLTYHLELPYTILSQPYVAYAIRKTYCQGICANCSLVDHPPACSARNVTEEAQTEGSEHRRKQHHSHRNHRLHRNLTDHTQLGEGDYEQHQHRNHHQHQHQHLADSEGGTHDFAADPSSQEQRNL